MSNSKSVNRNINQAVHRPQSVTFDGSDRVTQVIVYHDDSKTTIKKTFDITYSGDDPIIDGITYDGMKFNPSTLSFEYTNSDIIASQEGIITAIDLTTDAVDLTTAAVDLNTIAVDLTTDAVDLTTAAVDANTIANTAAVTTARLNGDMKMLAYLDSNFENINQGGHSTTMTSVYRDINNTDNLQWTNVAVGTTLSIVSTSALDGGAGIGISAIIIYGLDGNLDAQIGIVPLSGTTPSVTTTTWRAINSTFAVSGGVNGLGAVGEITISSTTDSTQWAKYLIGESGAPVGRYTVARNYRLLLLIVNYNSGVGGDVTVRFAVETLGGYQFSLGETYSGGGEFNTVFGGNYATFFPGGTTVAFRGFANSGNPFQRRLSVFFLGTLATETNWDSYKINP